MKKFFTLIATVAHGNEPSHHVLYMYNYVGQPCRR